MGCQESIASAPGNPQLRAGTHTFTYDYVYPSSSQDSKLLFKQCVHPLVDGLFKGYNATVFAYGQTGSGKTHTMGSSYCADGQGAGVIPDVMSTIFRRIGSMRDVEFCVRVSFVEIHKVL